MLTTNPFTDLALPISLGVMQTFVVVMLLLVVGGTIYDVIHKQSAKYFFANMRKSKRNQTRSVGGGEKIVVAIKTVAVDVLTSGEFCNQKRRIAHLLTMYGFIIFAANTVILIFWSPDSATFLATLRPLLWHLGALMVCIGGYWFWFFIRVDVAAEGHSPFRMIKADLFVLSLLATSSFALLWSVLQASGALFWAHLCFALFAFSTCVLCGGVPWSKFAHMFFKPAAAFEKRLSQADGSLNNLPPPVDAPAQFGLGIKRDPPRHY